MEQEVKEKTVNMEDMQAYARVLFNKGIGNHAICITAGSTPAKEVQMGNTFELVKDTTILVTFQNAITVASATIAVTHTPLGASEAVTEAAKPIYYRGAPLGANLIKAGMMVQMRYNGSQWEVTGDLTPSGFQFEIENGVLNLIPIGSATATVDNGVLNLTF